MQQDPKYNDDKRAIESGLRCVLEGLENHPLPPDVADLRPYFLYINSRHQGGYSIRLLERPPPDVSIDNINLILVHHAISIKKRVFCKPEFDGNDIYLLVFDSVDDLLRTCSIQSQHVIDFLAKLSSHIDRNYPSDIREVIDRLEKTQFYNRTQ
jgi:hypothetical protein